MHPDTVHDSRASETLSIGLGWFSLGLGVAELAAPRTLARFVGVPPNSRTVSMVRSYGAREFSNGLAILSQPDRSAWIWARVAGDTLDLATLASAMSSPSTNRGRAMLAAAAVLGVTALDVWCAQQLGRRESVVRRATSASPPEEESGLLGQLTSEGAASRSTNIIRIVEAITINQPLERVEERWNMSAALPTSLRNLTETVETMRSLVKFRPAPGARGTEVHVELEYEPTTSAMRNAIAKLFGQDPASQIRADLRRFKQLMETGEIPLSDGPSLWRPAQPAADPQDVLAAAGLEVSR